MLSHLHINASAILCLFPPTPPFSNALEENKFLPFWRERLPCFVRMEGFGVAFGVRALKKIALGCFTCIFALVGAWVGMVTGAVTGQTTETGFFRGAGIGAVSGAILAVEVFESLIKGDTLSKIGIFGSLVNGKIFPEWVSPAMLKAYQWQVSMVESSQSQRDESDIFDVSSNRGLTADFIRRLPQFRITNNTALDSRGEAVCCAICLQDLIEGESGRTLPICRHLFHVQCIDSWLLRHGSCPICRLDF